MESAAHNDSSLDYSQSMLLASIDPLSDWFFRVFEDYLKDLRYTHRMRLLESSRSADINFHDGCVSALSVFLFSLNSMKRCSAGFDVSDWVYGYLGHFIDSYRQSQDKARNDSDDAGFEFASGNFYIADLVRYDLRMIKDRAYQLISPDSGNRLLLGSNHQTTVRYLIKYYLLGEFDNMLRQAYRSFNEQFALSEAYYRGCVCFVDKAHLQVDALLDSLFSDGTIRGLYDHFFRHFSDQAEIYFLESKAYSRSDQPIMAKYSEGCGQMAATTRDRVTSIISGVC